MIVLGAGGTAGLLTLCALRQQLGSNGEIIAIEYDEKAVADILDLGVSDVVVRGDATHTIELVEQVHDACSNAEYQADLTINVVNVPHTEFATILLTRKDGRILFSVWLPASLCHITEQWLYGYCGITPRCGPSLPDVLDEMDALLKNLPAEHPPIIDVVSGLRE